MKNTLKSFLSNELLLFALIFVFAAVFYLFNLDFSDLWSDEIYTKSMLEGSIKDFYSRLQNDLHPPLYYLGLRLFTSLFDITPYTLRLFSVLGVLSTLLLGYFAGQRVFGKQGALYFCLMLAAIPMLSVYSHQARMYTWAAFFVTGVFIFSCLFIKTGEKRDLVLLLVFTLAAVYTHYYSMAAAFVANLFVFLYLVFAKNRKWIHHLISMLLVVLLFLPWMFMFAVQVNRVQQAFWAPEIGFDTILSCIAIPFTEQFWITGYSRTMTVLIYSLIALSLGLSFSRSFSANRLALWLSVAVFLGTLILVTIISLFSKPILYSRYVAVIVTMLVVPTTVLILMVKKTWLRLLLTMFILLLGLRVSVPTSYFSYGPYKQAIGHLAANYPEVKKVLHITEITAGPMTEYNGNSGLNHYWLKAEMSNVDAFKSIKQYHKPEEFLQPGEVFCAVRFHNLELNEENLDLVISESELIRTDTVRDNKVNEGIFIQIYLLKYKGR